MKNTHGGWGVMSHWLEPEEDLHVGAWRGGCWMGTRYRYPQRPLFADGVGKVGNHMDSKDLLHVCCGAGMHVMPLRKTTRCVGGWRR